jgi:hypothetical protein
MEDSTDDGLEIHLESIFARDKEDHRTSLWQRDFSPEVTIRDFPSFYPFSDHKSHEIHRIA